MSKQTKKGIATVKLRTILSFKSTSYQVGRMTMVFLLLSCLFLQCNIAQEQKSPRRSKPAVVTEIRTPISTSQDGLAFSERVVRGIAFSRSSYKPTQPFSKEMEEYLKRAAEYLKKNPDRSLTINGKYDRRESNQSVFPNLGMARASEIKWVLVNLGAPSSQLLGSSTLLEDNSLKDRLENGVTFSFGKAIKKEVQVPVNTPIQSVVKPAKAPNKEEILRTIKKFPKDVAAHLIAIRGRFAGKPIFIYFGNEPPISEQQLRDFSDLAFYLEKVVDSSVEVSGHTDNHGAETANIRLSRKRAERVKDYLVSIGFNAKQVSARGYGPTKPIASNATESGRDKNRRIEITLL